MIEELKKYLDRTPREEVKKEWEEITKQSCLKPTINEFSPQLLTKEELEENRIPSYKTVNLK